jgi:hypothetical protein
MVDHYDDLALLARKWAEETTRAQGLPLHLSDPVALRKIATIFGWDRSPANDLDLGPTTASTSGRQA